MYKKKSSIQKFLHFCQNSPVIGVFHFNSLSVQDWKIVKNEIYKVDEYAKLVVVQSQGTKNLLEERCFQELSSLCTGPTCFLFCSSFSSFQALMNALTQRMDKHTSRSGPPLTFIGAKYHDTFITQAHLPHLLNIKSDPSKVLIIKTPAANLHKTLYSSVFKLLAVFKANNGN